MCRRRRSSISLDPPLNATKLSLAFRDGEGSTCPRDVRTLLQIVTNGPGLAPVSIEPPLPGVVSNLLIGTKRVGDQYLGTYETTLKIKDDHRQVYRAQAKNGLSSASCHHRRFVPRRRQWNPGRQAGC